MIDYTKEVTSKDHVNECSPEKENSLLSNKKEEVTLKEAFQKLDTTMQGLIDFGQNFNIKLFSSQEK